MSIEHIVLHVFLDYGNIQFSIRYSSKLGIYKTVRWGPEFVIFSENKRTTVKNNSQSANRLGEIKPSTNEVITKITAIKNIETKQNKKIVKS